MNHFKFRFILCCSLILMMSNFAVAECWIVSELNGYGAAVPPHDFEPWRMYAVYETGYDVGQDILKGVHGSGYFLQGCMEKSDYSQWKAIGWDAETIRKAEKLFFYGCISANTKKMTKEEFMTNMFKNIMERKA